MIINLCLYLVQTDVRFNIDKIAKKIYILKWYNMVVVNLISTFLNILHEKMFVLRYISFLSFNFLVSNCTDEFLCRLGVKFDKFMSLFSNLGQID